MDQFKSSEDVDYLKEDPRLEPWLRENWAILIPIALSLGSLIVSVYSCSQSRIATKASNDAAAHLAAIGNQAVVTVTSVESTLKDHPGRLYPLHIKIRNSGMALANNILYNEHIAALPLGKGIDEYVNGLDLNKTAYISKNLPRESEAKLSDIDIPLADDKTADIIAEKLLPMVVVNYQYKDSYDSLHSGLCAYLYNVKSDELSSINRLCKIK